MKASFTFGLGALPALLGLAMPAHGQQVAAPAASAPAPDYLAQAVAASLTEEINQKLYWRGQALKLQAELTEAQAGLNEAQMELNKAQAEGRRLGEEIANLHAPKTPPVGPAEQPLAK
jgi:hypothetical protein